MTYLMSLLEQVKKSKVTNYHKTLLYIGINGETYQYDLFKELKCSYRQNQRDLKILRTKDYIRVTDTAHSSKKGVDMNILGITIKGLIFLFQAIPEFWDHFEEVASIPNNRSLLPLVFGKMNLFKGNEYLYGELLKRLRAIFTLFAKRSLIMGGASFWEAHRADLDNRMFQEFFHPKRLNPTKILEREETDDDYKTLMGIDSEILLNLFFGYHSEADPFMAVIYAPITYAEDIWSESKTMRDDISYDIMEIAASDPELRAFFELTIQARERYVKRLNEAYLKLGNDWNLAKQQGS